ncbi:hypothetical protein ANN_17960 [Periplaneta americana]|uniref:Uncharacterized protein n=1 Tax=Periplaneta americana TaxID=6978 RepID=A0ABQ8SNR8_PERAM|nr:hypothetical protein ANN_17960 [Periplaneta americana]
MLLLYALFQAELKTITTVRDATVRLKLWLMSWVHAHLAKLFVTADITRSDACFDPTLVLQVLRKSRFQFLFCVPYGVVYYIWIYEYVIYVSVPVYYVVCIFVVFIVEYDIFTQHRTNIHTQQ